MTPRPPLPPAPPPAADLAARREQLRMRSEMLRQSLALRSRDRLRPALRLSDRVADGTQWLRQHREWVGVAGAALLGAMAVRPRALLRLGTHAFAAWQVFQRAQPMLRMFMRRH